MCGGYSEMCEVSLGWRWDAQTEGCCYDLTVNDCQEMSMTQITARVSEDLVAQIDRAAEALKRTRADVVRQAIEYYLADLEDLRLGSEALADPSDPVLDWDEVRAALVAKMAG